MAKAVFTLALMPIGNESGLSSITRIHGSTTRKRYKRALCSEKVFWLWRVRSITASVWLTECEALSITCA